MAGAVTQAVDGAATDVAAAARGYEVRPGTDADHAWVYDSWLRSSEDTALARSMRRATWSTGQRRVIAGLLARCDLRVACDPAAQTTILGWALVEPGAGAGSGACAGVLHYVHVKAFIRRRGIARELVGAGPQLRYTAKTLDFERWSRGHVGWEYSPFEAWLSGGES